MSRIRGIAQEWQQCYCEAGLGPDAHRLRTAAGDLVEASLRCGAFAEEATLHRSQVVRLPDGIDWPTAALLGCGVITGIGAVLNTSTVDEDSTVAVAGVGGVGLNAVRAPPDGRKSRRRRGLAANWQRNAPHTGQAAADFGRGTSRGS